MSTQPAPSFIVHSRMMGTFKKPQPFLLLGIEGRHDLVVQKLGDSGCSDSEYAAKYHAPDSIHTIPMTDTIEGYRFQRTIRNTVVALVKLGKEIIKANRAAQKADKDYQDRGIRCGVCSVCFGDFIATPGNLVLHGYSRPGHGYIIGDCHGMPFPPLEVSCAGAKSWLEILQAHQKHTNEALANAAKADSHRVPDGYAARGEVQKYKTINRGEIGFESAKARLISELEFTLRQLDRDIATYTEVIRTWAPKQFPRTK